MKAILLFLLILPISLFAQTSEIGVAKIHYLMRHKRDTLDKTNVHQENMCLLIGKSASIFYSTDRERQSSEVEKNLKEQEKNWTGPGLPRTKMPTSLKSFSNEEIYLFQNQDKIYVNEYLLQNYLYHEPKQEIKWELEPETKTIGRTICQKATANYKGRNWIVWFAPDIPFETGPWKLHGLPGLIFEASDVKNEIQFLFTGFEKASQESSLKIELPKNVIKASIEEVKRLKNTMYKNSKAFFDAQMHARKGVIDTKEYAGFSYKKINNPIDLTDTK